MRWCDVAEEEEEEEEVEAEEEVVVDWRTEPVEELWSC